MCKEHACHYHFSYQDVAHQHILKQEKRNIFCNDEQMKYSIMPNKEKEAVLGIPHKGRSSEFVFTPLQSRPKEITKKQVSYSSKKETKTTNY